MKKKNLKTAFYGLGDTERNHTVSCQKSDRNRKKYLLFRNTVIHCIMSYMATQILLKIWIADLDPHEYTFFRCRVRKRVDLFKFLNLQIFYVLTVK